jgi:hypothetical protein
MKLIAFLATIPERVYILGFVGIFFLASVAAYFAFQDTRLLEKKIASKQKEVSDVYALREIYEARKQATDAAGPKETAAKGMSLASIEEIASKSLIGGHLVALRPASAKSDKDKRQMVVELKISGIPLGEVITFLQAIDSAGYKPQKLQLSLPGTGQTLLEMQASLIDGRVRD